MCVVSMVIDHYGHKWANTTLTPIPASWPTTPNWNPPVNWLSRQEHEEIWRQHEELKREVENMKELLAKAKLYDERNNEPDCAKDEKIDVVKRVAAAMGVDLGDLLK